LFNHLIELHFVVALFAADNYDGQGRAKYLDPWSMKLLSSGVKKGTSTCTTAGCAESDI
jgi:hypothetical protein